MFNYICNCNGEIYVLPEQEVLSTIQRLRTCTAREMKPEMGPWAAEYTVKMEDIQTNFRLTNENGQSCHKPVTSDYTELFAWPGGYQQYLQEQELSEDEKLLRAYNQKISLRASTGTKILLTGEEGTGKTVLCKKIAYDWAKGKFVRFSLVFYINEIRYDEAIENIIVDQYKSKIPDISAQVVKRILNKVCDKCLIVVDGLDVPGQSFKSKFIETFTDQKYSHLNIFAAARNDHNIESPEVFPTVVAIEPFSYPAFQNIASDKLRVVELFKSDSALIYPHVIGSKEQLSHNNPMLRTFLCVLAGSNIIDLSQGELSLGEIFTKLAGYIYNSHKFIDHVVKRIGKLAFQALINSGTSNQDIPTNDPLLEGNSHNIVRFKQTSMQIYLAALYFVLEIDAGKSVSSLFGSQCSEPLLLINDLFLYFVLWFLSQRTGEIVIAKRKKVYQALVTYVKERIDFSQLDLRDIIARYPALDITIAERQNDQFGLEFMKDIITACQNTKIFVAASDYPIEHILSKTDPLFPKLRMIGLFDRHRPFHVRDA